MNIDPFSKTRRVVLDNTFLTSEKAKQKKKKNLTDISKSFCIPKGLKNCAESLRQWICRVKSVLSFLQTPGFVSITCCSMEADAPVLLSPEAVNTCNTEFSIWAKVSLEPWKNRANYEGSTAPAKHTWYSLSFQTQILQKSECIDFSLCPSTFWKRRRKDLNKGGEYDGPSHSLKFPSQSAKPECTRCNTENVRLL
jgi:hypothetical protein